MNHTVDIECGITLLTFPRPTKKKKEKQNKIQQNKKLPCSNQTGIKTAT